MRRAPSRSRMTKILFLAGVAVIAASLMLGEAGVRKPTASAVAEIFGDYPGPCVAAPSAVTLEFVGLTSGCTATSGSCQSAEEFLITATSPSYTFQYCDTYKWTFGDDGTTVTTSYYPSIRHKFLGAGPRTVDLVISNQFGTTSPAKLTVPEPLTPCIPGSDRLCFSSNRFTVTLFAKDPRNPSKTGPGQSIVKTDLFGYFSIPALTGNPTNPEVFVKILDGRPVNGNFWVFWGGLTDLEYTLTVTDATAGKTETYFKPGKVSQGGADTSAFTGGPYVDPSGSCPTNANTVPTIESPVAPSTCSAPANGPVLCLGGNRFEISLTAVNKNPGTSFGQAGAGQALPETPDFGFFSIPALTSNPSNPEVFVKILDGRGITSHFWVFSGALTNFETTLRVEDTVTGKVFSYKTPAAGLADGGEYCGVVDTGSL